MIQVAVRIDGKRRLFLKKAYRRELPESWSEIPAARRLFFLKTLSEAKTTAAGRLAALEALLGLPRRVFLGLDADQIAALDGAMKWLELTPSPVPIISEFRHRCQKWLMPQPHFTDASCLRFAIADEAFDRFLKDGDEKHLRLLIATLAVPDDSETIASRADAEKRAALLEKLPPEVSLAVILFFSGVKQFIHRAYAALFEANDDDDPENDSAPRPPSLGWWGLFFDLAENGPFGKLPDVHRSNFHEVCLYLVRKKKMQEAEAIRLKMQSPHFADPTA